MDVLFPGNDQTLRVIGVQDEVSGEYLDSADVSCTIKNMDGSEVDGFDWPLELDYIADSEGNYIGNLDDAIEFIHTRSYILEIEAVFASFRGFWRFVRVARYRQP